MGGDSLPGDIHTIEWQQQVKGGNEKLQQFHTVLFPENMRAQSLDIIILPTQYVHVLVSSAEIVVQWDSYNYTLLSVVQCKHTFTPIQIVQLFLQLHRHKSF